MTPNKGKALERLVAALEKALSGAENVKIESPKRLPDKVAGNMREHDIVITLTHSHHVLTISIECKDMKKKVDAPIIESFIGKCEATGIDQGIVVSTSGFTQPAVKKASLAGMRCLSLEDALGFEWLLAGGVSTERADLVSSAWTIIPQAHLEHDDMSHYRLVDKTGKPVDDQVLRNNMARRFDQSKHRPEQGNDVVVRMEFSGTGLGLLDAETGEIHPIRRIIGDGTFHFTWEFSPFSMIKYKDESVDKQLGEAALARMEFGEVKGQLAVVRAPDGGTTITFIPDDESKGVSFKSPAESPDA